MRNFLKTSVALLFIAFSTSGNAQGGNGNTSASTELTVEVKEIFSIMVDEQAVINLDTKEKFVEGTKSAATNMTVFATRGYKIEASAANEKFSSSELTADELPLVNNIYIEINEKGITSATPRISQLSDSDQVVLDSNRGVKNKEFDVVYSIPVANTEAFLAAGGNTLTTIITYTISGK